MRRRPTRSRPPTTGPTTCASASGSEGVNRSPTIYRSKAVGEPPLMLALSGLLGAHRCGRRGRGLPELSATSTRRRRRSASSPPSRRCSAAGGARMSERGLPVLAEALRRGDAAMLRACRRAEGLRPRARSARRCLSRRSGILGTIGGGELEHAAIAAARESARRRAAPALLRMAARAGAQPMLRRCGDARLRAVRAGRPRLGAKARRGRGGVRSRSSARVDDRRARRAARATVDRRDAEGGAGLCRPARRPARPVFIRERINRAACRSSGCSAPAMSGERSRRAVAPLGFAITWIDGRAGQLPGAAAGGRAAAGARHAGARGRRGAAGHDLPGDDAQPSARRGDLRGGAARATTSPISA